MSEALALAVGGRGWTRPNPLVGSVVVFRGRAVGRGFHRCLGSAHGEIVALEDAGAKARGATLYVNLEPCVHHGRTPPCVPAIVAAGIRRVVVAHPDPDPRVRGKGVRALRKAGLRVDVGVLEREARRLNAGYLSALERGRPRIALKLATTIDGRIAPALGGSRWITGKPARRAAHLLRARHDTIVVGAETLRRDDPALTVRDPDALVLANGVAPLRVVVSSDLDLPLSARVFRPSNAGGTVVASIDPARLAPARRRLAARRARALARRGVGIWWLPARNGGVDLAALASKLVDEGRRDVLVEGGATLAAGLADRGLVDEVWLFVSPTMLGGAARAWGFGDAATSLASAWRLTNVVRVPLGDDELVYGEPARNGARARKGS